MNTYTAAVAKHAPMPRRAPHRLWDIVIAELSCTTTAVPEHAIQSSTLAMVVSATGFERTEPQIAVVHPRCKHTVKIEIHSATDLGLGGYGPHITAERIREQERLEQFYISLPRGAVFRHLRALPEKWIDEFQANPTLIAMGERIEAISAIRNAQEAAPGKPTR